MWWQNFIHVFRRFSLCFIRLIILSSFHTLPTTPSPAYALEDGSYLHPLAEAIETLSEALQSLPLPAMETKADPGNVFFQDFTLEPEPWHSSASAYLTLHVDFEAQGGDNWAVRDHALSNPLAFVTGRRAPPQAKHDVTCNTKFFTTPPINVPKIRRNLWYYENFNHFCNDRLYV